MKWMKSASRHNKAILGVAFALSILTGVAVGGLVLSKGSGQAEDRAPRPVKTFAPNPSGLAAADKEIGFHILVPTKFATRASALLGVTTIPGNDKISASAPRSTTLTFGASGVANPNPAKGDAYLEISQSNRMETSDAIDPSPPPSGAHAPEPTGFAAIDSPLSGIRIARRIEPGRTTYTFMSASLGTVWLYFGGEMPVADSDAIRMFESMK